MPGLGRGTSPYLLRISGGLEPETAAFLAQLPVQPGATQITNYNNLVYDLKYYGGTDNLSKHDRIWISATELQSSAIYSIPNPTSNPMTEVSSPAWTQYRGYQSGGTQYLETNYIPSTHGVNYLLDDACIWIYSRTNSAISAVDFGVYDGTNYTQMWARETDNNLYADINDTAGGNIAVANSTGLIAIKRITSGTLEVWKGASKVGDLTSITSSARPTKELYLLCRNANGAAANFSSRQIAAAGICNSQVNIANLEYAITRYMTAVGANV